MIYWMKQKSLKKLLFFYKLNQSLQIFFKQFFTPFKQEFKNKIFEFFLKNKKLWIFNTCFQKNNKIKNKRVLRILFWKKNLLKKLNLILLSLSVFWSCLAFDLKITEVFPYSKNERIEIFNNDKTTFSGNIEISWIKSQNLIIKNIVLNPWKTIIIWDSWNIKINDSQVLDKNGLSMSDQSAIDIKLLIDWVVVDDFVVSIQDIISTNKKNSFEKILLNKDIVVKSVNVYSSNSILPWIQANPWIVHILGEGQDSPILHLDKDDTQSNKKQTIKKDKKTEERDKSILSNSSNKIDDLVQKNLILEQELKKVKTELTLTKTCLTLLSSKLKKNRNLIYYKDWFEKIDNFYKIESLKIKNNTLFPNMFLSKNNNYKTIFSFYDMDSVENIVYNLVYNIWDYYFIQTYNDFINLLLK